MGWNYGKNSWLQKSEMYHDIDYLTCALNRSIFEIEQI